MNHPSGLSPETLTVYRLRVTHPTDRAAELAQRAGLPRDLVISAEQELTNLGLLRTSPGGGSVAVNPETATEELIAATDQEILQRQVALGAVRARMNALSSHYLEARSMRAARGDIEVVRGLDNVRALIEDLARTASSSVDTLASGGGQSEQALRAALPNDLRVLSRGVRVRIVFQDSARRHRPTARYVSRLAADGGEARCLSHLPTRMILYGQDCAVLPIDHARTSIGVVVIRDTAVLGFLRLLYNHYWARATSFLLKDTSTPRGLDREDHEVLTLLAAGKTNPTISRELGISPRTVARIVASLMERLEADSRFQAGIRAAQLGWLD
jgi:DNA-binding CsgD family transcriptional regulator/sugar-specific transcriptional regulator TrmB